MEDLTLHLGAEQSIRITPHPVVTVRGNTRSIGKSNQTVTSTHVIDLKNTKDSVVAIDVSDQLPLSSDEKIKVGVAGGIQTCKYFFHGNNTDSLLIFLPTPLSFEALCKIT